MSVFTTFYGAPSTEICESTEIPEIQRVDALGITLFFCIRSFSPIWCRLNLLNPFTDFCPFIKSAEIRRIVWMQILGTLNFVFFTVMIYITDNASFGIYIYSAVSFALISTAMILVQTLWVLLKTKSLNSGNADDAEPSASQSSFWSPDNLINALGTNTTESPRSQKKQKEVLHLEIFDVIREPVGFDVEFQSTVI